MADIQTLNVNGNAYDISTTWNKVTGKPSKFPAEDHSHDYLPLTGGTLSGTTGLTLTNSKVWVQGGLASGGNSNRMTIDYGAPSELKYGSGKRGLMLYSNAIAICDPYNGASNNDCAWLRHLEETTNSGIFEIATGDDGDSSEEIRFRKYNTSNQIVSDILVPSGKGTLALTSHIPSIPSSLPANGGNADTVDNKHASDFAAASHSHNYIYPKRYNTYNTHSYYKININSYTSWMLAFNVRVYKSYKYYDIRFSGYNYGTSKWYTPTASLTDGDAAITVYFGYDADWKLWVAIPGGNYTGIEITNVTNGYTPHGYENNISGLFTITELSSLTGTTQSTQTIYPPSRTDTNTWRPVTNTYTGSDQSTCVSQYGTNALYNTLVNGYANSAGYASLLTRQGGTSDGVASWHPLTSYVKVWGQKFTDTSISGDTGDILYYLRKGSGSSTELCVCIDGDYYAMGNAGTPQRVWHAGNLTNLNQLTNGPGYITGINKTMVTNALGYTPSSSDTNTWLGDGIWAPATNVKLEATANSQEWSFDIYRNGKTGCYWHVWDSVNNSLLTVYPETGQVHALGGFFQGSDERLKDFYDSIPADLDKLSKLRKNYFKFHDKDKLEIGVSAQEVQSLYPEIVNENKDGYLTVAYDKLSVVALAAVDKLHEENKQLKSENDALRKRIEAIENILNKLTISQ